MLLFFMQMKSAILCDLYFLTYIICAIETPCDANLFLPFVSIHFSIACAIFNPLGLHRSISNGSEYGRFSQLS